MYLSVLPITALRPYRKRISRSSYQAAVSAFRMSVALESAMTAAFGEGPPYVSELGLYLNLNPVEGKTINRKDLERVAAETLRQRPHRLSRLHAI